MFSDRIESLRYGRHMPQDTASIDWSVGWTDTGNGSPPSHDNDIRGTSPQSYGTLDLKEVVTKNRCKIERLKI